MKIQKKFHIREEGRNGRKIEIMNLLQSKQVLEHEPKRLAYGSVEIRENNSNKYYEGKDEKQIKRFIEEKCYISICV